MCYLKKYHVLKNTSSLRFLKKLPLSFWPEAEKFSFFLLDFFQRCKKIPGLHRGDGQVDDSYFVQWTVATLFLGEGRLESR